MALPPAEQLFEHLVALRDAADPTDPCHDARWREVARWIAAAFPGTGGQLEDARQEALVSLIRNVSSMHAEAPLQAAKWVITIVKRKRLDALRSQRRDPVHKALRNEPRGDDRSPLIDRLRTEEGRQLTPEMIEAIVSAALEHTHRVIEETEPLPRKRQLQRTQAQATLLRLVMGAQSMEIERALQLGEPIGRDRLYKWVERGRPTVLLGLDRWEASDVKAGAVIEVLREIVEERRIDAGVPRPHRRKERGP